jgi:hypothetical protein
MINEVMIEAFLVLLRLSEAPGLLMDSEGTKYAWYKSKENAEIDFSIRQSPHQLVFMMGFNPVIIKITGSAKEEVAQQISKFLDVAEDGMVQVNLVSSDQLPIGIMSMAVKKDFDFTPFIVHEFGAD